jgi:hypothetical protein
MQPSKSKDLGIVTKYVFEDIETWNLDWGVSIKSGYERIPWKKNFYYMK